MLAIQALSLASLQACHSNKLRKQIFQIKVTQKNASKHFCSIPLKAILYVAQFCLCLQLWEIHSQNSVQIQLGLV